MVMTRTLTLISVLLCLVAASFAVLVPAGAQSPQETIERARAERDAARSARAAQAAELEGLAASEAELEAALAALADQIAAEEAKVASAQSVISQSEQEAVAFRDRMAVAVGERRRLADAAAARAVESYIRPSPPTLATLFDNGDVYESVRRTAVLEAVTTTDADVDDRLRSIELELLDLEAGTVDAAERSARWEQRLAEALADLDEAKEAQQRLLADLQLRIADVQAEIDQLEATEAELNAAISSAQAQIAAEEARRARAAAQASRSSSSGGGGGGGGGGGSAPSGSGQLGWPASGVITSGYGTRWGRLHAGIDIAAPTGTGIFAADSGVVSYSGTMGGYGQVILIDHGNGIVTLYAHQSNRLVAAGASVSRGTQIGQIGSTGSSTGPHLHFEVRVNGSAVDPMRFL